jgi:FkbM family methyltransferase
LWRTGIYDLAVTETLFRLAEPGELVVDAGANIGYMTSVLAAAVGPAGEVISFEPQPEVLSVLHSNVAGLARARFGKVEVRGVGLSDRAGRAHLAPNDENDFNENMGTARITDEAIDGWSIDVVMLDEVLQGRAVGVLKIDVEGHEEQALAGAAQLISQRRIRDIVFEELPETGTGARELLRSSGYTFLWIDERLRGLRVADAAPPRKVAYDPMSVVATLDAERARRRLGSRGWRSLRRGAA